MSISNSTVVVLQGDPTADRAVHDLVAPMGILTQPVDTAEAFLQREDVTQCACLVLELRLPGMSGLELLQTLNDREIYFPTVVWTGSADVSSAVAAMQLGAFTLLEKSCHEFELWDAIRAALTLHVKLRETQQRKAAIRCRLDSLTNVERQTLDMIVAGLPNKAIASRSGVSLRTVEGRRKNVFRKTFTHCVAELVTAVRDAEQPLCYCRVVRDAAAASKEPVGSDPSVDPHRALPSLPNGRSRTA